MATTTGLATDLITFSRASLGTVIANDGKIKWPSHNLLLASEQFDNAARSRFNVQAFGSGSTANATTAPNGTTTADFIAETAIDNAHILYNTTNHTLDIGTKYTFGAFGKSGTRNHLSLSVNSAGGAGAGVVYDLNAGTVTQSGTTSAAYTIVSSSITSVGSGWYYCSMTFSSTQVTASTCLCISNSGTPTVQASTQRPTYLGDGTSGLYVWGAQLNRADLGGMLLNSSTYPYYNPTTTSAAFHAARLDYEPSSLSAKGLLIEEQRTNLITYSDQFDNAAWTKLATTVTANATTSPDGTTNADKIIPDATTSTKYFHQVLTTTASTTYSWSIFLKAAEYTTAVIYAINPASPFQYFQASIDLTTGVISGTTSGNGGTFTSATATSYGNGWWRVSLVGTIGTGTSFVARVYPNTIASFTGNGTSGIYAWGAQLEAGVSPSSYIPTTSASVTRSADFASIATSSFPYSATEGTLIVSCQTSNSAGIRQASALSDGTFNNRYTLRIDNGTSYTAASFISGVVDWATGVPIIAGGVNKVALAYKSGNNATTTNGLAATTITNATVVSGVNTLSIGNVLGSSHLNGWVQNVTYIPRRLTNTELQGRTI